MSNRIKIVNATAEDFALESLGSAPTSGSIGDHADGRIAKYGASVYIWDNNIAEWVRFAPVSEYTALETRMSTQEADRSTMVSSLEVAQSALDSRLGLEESVQEAALDSLEAARSQAVASVVTARESVDSSLETRLSQEEVAHSTELSAQKSTALAEEAALSGELSAAVSLREADVSTEAARASTAQSTLSAGLESEISIEVSADDSLTSRLSVQVAKRESDESTMNANLSSEIVRAQSVEASHSAALSTETARVSAIVAGTGVPDLENFSQIVSYVNSLDVTADASLSAEFSELTSNINSSEASLEAVDSSLLARLILEESRELSAETSLDARISDQASVLDSVNNSYTALLSVDTSLRVAGDDSLTAVLSSMTVERSEEDSTLQAAIDSAETARISEDSVLTSSISSAETARIAQDSVLTSSLSDDSDDRASLITSLTANIEEQVDTDENSLMVAGDSALTSTLAVDAAARASVDTSLTAAISNENLSQEAADSTLTSNIAVQESVQASMDASLEDRISDESSARQSADSSLDTELTSQINEVEALVSGVLLDANASYDTFVEIMEFISSVDLAADNEFESYMSNVDSAIGSLQTARSTGDASLTTAISAAESAQASALDSAESRATSAETSVETAVSTLEAAEDNRHLRIDFTNQTSFTVAQGDLPSGFTAGNGMVQIFHEISSGTYRHLVAPATYDPSTGAMTFDLGSTAKDGFAVFYSFAGDDTAAAMQFQFGTEDQGYDENDPPEALSQTFSGAVYSSSSLKILDHENQEFTDPYGSGYNQWVVKSPFTVDSEYNETTFETTYTPYVNWGEGGDQPYIKYYSQQSTDGGSTWSTTGTYTDTFDIDTSYGFSYNNYDSSFSIPNSSFPTQTPVVGSAYRVWAEGYTESGDLVIQVGSESSPYYLLDMDYDMTHYSNSEYINGSYEYWDTTNENNTVKSEFGDTVSITLENPSNRSAGSTYAYWNYLVDFGPNYNASQYGWDEYSTDWTLSGTDASDFRLVDNGTDSTSTVSNASSISLAFKKDSNGNRVIPSTGTYSVSVTAQAQTSSSASNFGSITWNFTVVIS